MRTEEIELRRIDSKYLVPRKHDRYRERGLLPILDKLAFGPNVILKGPKGGGKTLAIEEWAARQGVPLLRQDCSEETSTRDLIGTFSMEGDTVFFMLGTLTAAIEVANEDGGCVVVLEEINTLPPQAQKILNPIADYRQEIGVTKIGKIFRVKEGAKVWLVGTMNPNYGGTYNLNEDFRSRFEFIEVGYMGTKDERELLHSVFSSPPSAQERQLVERVLNLAKETRGGDMEYALSTRDLVAFIENIARLGSWEQALKLLEGKYEGENVKNFQARVKSVFQTDLQGVSLL